MSVNSISNSFEDPEPQTEDTLALSFLDVLCCGLGAGICLFLIFSVMPHVGISGSGLQVKTNVFGSDSNAGLAGARFEDWDDIVQNADITIIVKLTPKNGSNAQVLQDQLVFENLPNNAVNSNYMFSNSKSRGWLIQMSDGMKPPNRLIACNVLKGIDLSGFDCSVSVMVGGKTQHHSPSIPQTNPNTNAPMFQIDLTNDIWMK